MSSRAKKQNAASDNDKRRSSLNSGSAEDSDDSHTVRPRVARDTLEAGPNLCPGSAESLGSSTPEERRAIKGEVCQPRSGSKPNQGSTLRIQRKAQCDAIRAKWQHGNASPRDQGPKRKRKHSQEASHLEMEALEKKLNRMNMGLDTFKQRLDHAQQLLDEKPHDPKAINLRDVRAS